MLRRTALIVVVPEAEPYVAELRQAVGKLLAAHAALDFQLASVEPRGRWLERRFPLA